MNTLIFLIDVESIASASRKDTIVISYGNGCTHQAIFVKRGTCTTLYFAITSCACRSSLLKKLKYYTHSTFF